MEFTKKINQDIVCINTRHSLYQSKREGASRINRRASPRKVMIDRMRKIISTINIEALLKQTEIDFSNENPLDSLLPLEFFEDKDFDIFTAEE